MPSRQLVSIRRPRDEAHGLQWNDDLVKYVHGHDKPAPHWSTVFTQRRRLSRFWYRQSKDPLTGLMFHNDLLTPGLVRPTIRRQSCRA